MGKLAILAAAATLAACATHDRDRGPAPAVGLEAPATAAYVLRPGYGRVTDVTSVVFPNSTSRGLYRLTLRMDDGTVQKVDVRGPAVPLDARVEITFDRRIRYPLASR